MALFLQAGSLAYGLNVLPDHHGVPPEVRAETRLHGGEAPGTWRRQAEESANWSGPLYCWFWGGINYQIEHHLFPRLPHDLYPSLAPLVRAVCQQHGVSYVHHPSLTAALSAVHRSFSAAAAPWSDFCTRARRAE